MLAEEVAFGFTMDGLELFEGVGLPTLRGEFSRVFGVHVSYSFSSVSCFFPILVFPAAVDGLLEELRTENVMLRLDGELACSVSESNVS